MSGIETALISLPLYRNPDSSGKRRLFEDEKFIQVATEISKRFGGGVLHRYKTESPQGWWWDQGVLYRDELAVFEVDIPADEASRNWLRDYARKTLLSLFEQEAIYLRFVGPVKKLLIKKEKIRP